jgi:O-antigen ligase
MIFQLSGPLVLAWSILAVIRSRKAVRSISLGLAVNAFILSLVGSYFKITGAEDILNYFASVNPKFFASFTYHNHWVAFPGFHLFLASGLLSYYRLRDREYGRMSNLQGFLWVMCFFIFLSLFLVESRTGLLVAVLYIGILFATFLLHRVRNRKRDPAMILGLLTGLFALGFISYQIVLPQLSNTTDRIKRSLFEFWDEEKEVDDFRFNVGPRITADLIEEKPVLGWGWGSYPFAMSIYAADYIDGMAQFAHNDWLQFISELGGLGLFLFIFPLVHMSAYFRSFDDLTSFTRWGVAVLLFVAFFEGPFTNPVVLASVLIIISGDLSLRHEKSAK